MQDRTHPHWRQVEEIVPTPHLSKYEKETGNGSDCQAAIKKAHISRTVRHGASNRLAKPNFPINAKFQLRCAIHIHSGIARFLKCVTQFFFFGSVIY